MGLGKDLLEMIGITVEVEKKPRRRPRAILIPEDKVEEFWTLVDEMTLANKAGAGRVERYRLWKSIEDWLPETRTGKWSVKAITGPATAPRVHEEG